MKAYKIFFSKIILAEVSIIPLSMEIVNKYVLDFLLTMECCNKK